MYTFKIDTLHYLKFVFSLFFKLIIQPTNIWDPGYMLKLYCLCKIASEKLRIVNDYNCPE